ncbi:MAG: DUF2232 domain-containing protein [Alphaproteobacteria bacterium]
MFRQSVIALGAGVLSTAIYAAVLTGSLGGLILAYLAGVPLFMAGLSGGVAAVGLAATAATVLVGLFADALGAAVYALFYGAPAVLLIRQALLSRTGQDGHTEWYPTGLLITVLIAYAAGLFLLAMVFLGGQGAGVEASVRDALAEGLERFMPERPEGERIAIAGAWSTLVPAMIVGSWVLMIAINGALAQGLLVRFGRNLRPSPAFADLQVPTWLAVAVVATGAVALTAEGAIGLVSRTLAILSALPFFFQGLAVVHALTRGWSARVVVLIVFYVLLIMFGWPVILVAGLGLAEQWLKIRQRLAGTGIVRKEE